MKHINVYGPAGSGKTRNAEALRKKYMCERVIDEGRHGPTPTRLSCVCLILSQDPVTGSNIKNVPIDEALRDLA